MATRYITYKNNGSQSHQLDTFPTKEEAIESAKSLHDPDWPDTQSIDVWLFEGDSYFGRDCVFNSSDSKGA